jgi:hypothetical protein
MKKKSVRKKRSKTEEAGPNGGARPGAGRPKGSCNKSTLEFRNYVRESTERAVDLHVEVMDNKNEWTSSTAICSATCSKFLRMGIHGA